MHIIMMEWTDWSPRIRPPNQANWKKKKIKQIPDSDWKRCLGILQVRVPSLGLSWSELLCPGPNQFSIKQWGQGPSHQDKRPMTLTLSLDFCNLPSARGDARVKTFSILGHNPQSDPSPGQHERKCLVHRFGSSEVTGTFQGPYLGSPCSRSF